MKLKMSSDERSPEQAPELLASANLANSVDRSRSQSEPYRAGDGIGTPYGNLVFKGVGDDGYLHVQTRTTDYRVPTHLNNDRDEIRAWAIRSVEQGHINRGDLYPGSAGNPPPTVETPRPRSEPYRTGDGIGTPYGNLVFKGLGDDGFYHVQSRTSDYRVPTHLGNDRDEIRAWAIRSVEQGHISRDSLYQGSSGNPGSPGEQPRSRGEPYKPGEGIGTPHGNLLFKGLGDDGFYHVQSRTTDYRIPPHVGTDRDSVRAWAIRSVEQGHIDRNTLYREGQEPQGVPRLSNEPAKPAPGASGFYYASQGNDLRSGDFPRDRNGNATIPTEWQRTDDDFFRRLRDEINMQNPETDAQLLGRFNLELQAAAHLNPIATALFDHFAANTGQPFNSPPGSPWSDYIKDSGEARRIGNTLTERLYAEAEKQYARTGQVDFGTIRIPITPEDRAAWGDKPWNAAFGAFGGTDGLQIELNNARFDPETKKISGTARITIIDTFGLSNTDNDTQGQVAMWLLQHQRGYQPFIHTVQYDVDLGWAMRSKNPNEPRRDPRIVE
jgi:TfoX/Sxy family transcriptional regulator of competence genes